MSGIDAKKIRTRHIHEAKANGTKISVLTSYDALTASIFDEAGIDMLLVGDSAANVVLGRDTTLSITLDEMIVLAKAVTIAARRALVIVDLPFGTYEISEQQAVESAVRVMRETGATAVKIEGGDVLVAREDVLLIGSGARTSPQAIDLLIQELCREKSCKRHVIVQQLPETPESFIHLDMVFTFLDKNTAMVYKPLILNSNPYKTVHIQIENGKVVKISPTNNIPAALKKLGMEVEPVICGGKADDWDQEREQWHSGANFLAIAPGKVLSYARNINTLEELNKKEKLLLRKIRKNLMVKVLTSITSFSNVL